jgi:uncharacterized protein (DUF342 family)
MDHLQKNEGSLEEVCEISISSDLLTATLKYKKNNFSIPITEENVTALINQKKISYGICTQNISNFISQPDTYMGQEVVIAEGLEPLDGEDAYIEMIYQQKDKKAPKENEDGSIDFYSMIEIANVDPGQLLAKKISATEGVDGISVLNTEVKEKVGKDLKVKPGKNVVMKQDTQELYSAIAGQVSLSEVNKINVFPIFEVNGDLDFEIGNIDFVGNVVIRGSVPTGFKVKAKGDIRITGGVEGAELEAEGSIRIQSGITAQQKGFIKAGRDVETTFIVNGTIMAEGNVEISQSIMHSEISAGESIICLGAKGLIVGGALQAGKSVKCRTIGNMMATPTTIEVGASPKLINRLKEVQLQLKEQMVTIGKTDQAIHVLNQILSKLGKLPDDKRKLQFKLMNTKFQVEKVINQLKQELKELQEATADASLASVEVTGHIYQGSKLVFGKYIKYIRDSEQRVKYRLEHDEVVSNPLV